MRAHPSILFAVIALACSDAEPPSPGEAPEASELPELSIDTDEAARLRALGYGETVDDDEDDRDGVVTHLEGRAFPGLRYFTNVRGCSSQLIDLAGRVLREWSHTPCGMWGNSVLLENGDVLAVHRMPRKGRQRSRGLRELHRFDVGGRELWSRRLPVHHDVEVTPSGHIATLTYEHRLVPEIDPEVPVRDHAIALLSQDGALVREIPMLDLLRRAPAPFELKPIAPHFSTPDQMREIDLIHSNSLEWMRRPLLASRDPLYRSSNVLVSLRTQDVILVIDTEREEVVWSWGQDQMSGPHDATVLDDGNFLVFDNGLGRGWSRVIELDPLERRIVWEYRAPEGFFTATRGAAQRLANGNTLVTDSEAGRAFEVTPDGEIVWDHRNPNRDQSGDRSIVVRMRAIPDPPGPEGPFAWSD